ncbi:MAG TPA: hypothetical protein VIK72_14665 [Clostridiaceae bacterium]
MLDILNIELKDILKDELYLQLKESLIKNFKNELFNNDLKQYFYNLGEEKMRELELTNKSFKDILPKGFENNIKVLVYNKGPELIEVIKEFLLDEKFQNKFKIEINKFLSNMNPMAFKFISSENIFLKLKTSLTSYLDDPETKMNLIIFVNDKIDKFSEKGIEDTVKFIPYEGKLSVIKAIVDKMLQVVVEDKMILSVLNSFETQALKYKTLGELLLSMGITEQKISNSIFFK